MAPSGGLEMRQGDGLVTFGDTVVQDRDADRGRPAGRGAKVTVVSVSVKSAPVAEPSLVERSTLTVPNAPLVRMSVTSAGPADSATAERVAPNCTFPALSSGVGAT